MHRRNQHNPRSLSLAGVFFLQLSHPGEQVQDLLLADGRIARDVRVFERGIYPHLGLGTT